MASPQVRRHWHATLSKPHGLKNAGEHPVGGSTGTEKQDYGTRGGAWIGSKT